jgi:putative transposase
MVGIGILLRVCCPIVTLLLVRKVIGTCVHVIKIVSECDGMWKLLKKLTSVPRVIVTDKLRSYGAAKREMLPSVEHRQHRSLNNWAENSHQPTRQRERRMQRFKSPGHAQRFLAAYGPIAQYFRPRRHRFPIAVYRQERQQRFDIWQAMTTRLTAA